MSYTRTGFYTGFFSLGGNVHVAAAIVSVCVNTPYLGESGGMLPPAKFLNLQPLRRFLVAPETTYTVWFVSACCGKAT